MTWSRNIKFLFWLATSLTYGCVPSFHEITPQVDPALSMARTQPMASPEIKAIATAPHIESLALLHSEEDKTSVSDLSPTPSNGATSKAPEKKLPRPQNRERQVKVQEETSTSLQGAPGPRADDRLLNLVEKDLDKAVEQPPARRRLEFSKAVTEDPKVRYFIKYFSGRGRGQLEILLGRSGKFMPMISKVLREEGLPEELAYLALIESGFNTGARSRRGAAGLWQFIPSTARLYGLRIDSWVDERRDPVKSTRAAAAYLKDLHSYFGRWYLATAAYNAGQGRIDRALQTTGANDFWTLGQKARLSEETRNFVPKFVAVSLMAADPQKYGLGDIQYEAPLDYEEVETETPLRLAAIAQMSETTLATIQELNPALLKNSTPPGDRWFRVKVPLQKAEVFARSYHQEIERKSQQPQVVTHEVKKGETLISIARRYGQKVSVLMKLNGLTASRLQVGQKIKVMLQGLRGG
jgi:membrane-bound lytic murein transglycosylase D